MNLDPDVDAIYKDFITRAQAITTLSFQDIDETFMASLYEQSRLRGMIDKCTRKIKADKTIQDDDDVQALSSQQQSDPTALIKKLPKTVLAHSLKCIVYDFFLNGHHVDVTTNQLIDCTSNTCNHVILDNYYTTIHTQGEDVLVTSMYAWCKQYIPDSLWYLHGTPVHEYYSLDEFEQTVWFLLNVRKGLENQIYTTYLDFTPENSTTLDDYVSSLFAQNLVGVARKNLVEWVESFTRQYSELQEVQEAQRNATEMYTEMQKEGDDENGEEGEEYANAEEEETTQIATALLEYGMKQAVMQALEPR